MRPHDILIKNHHFLSQFENCIFHMFRFLRLQSENKSTFINRNSFLGRTKAEFKSILVI